MNYLHKGLHVSVVIHAAVFGLIAMGSLIQPAKHDVMTIDFTVNDTCACRETCPKKAVAVEKKQESPVMKAENTPAPETKPEIKQEKAADKALAPAPVLSQNQAPVAAQEQKRVATTNSVTDAGDHKGYTAPAQTHAPAPAAATENSSKTREAVYLKESFTCIRDSVQKKAAYPKIARKMGWQGKVLISFIVAADGFAREIKIVQSSGCEILDQSTIEAVKKALPFPKPPVEARLVVPVIYRLISE